MKNSDSFWLKSVLSGTVLMFIYKCINNFADVRTFFERLFDVIFPCIAGVGIALVLLLPAKKLENALKKTPVKYVQSKARAISVSILYVLILLLVILETAFVVPRLYGSLCELAKKIPEYTRTADNYFSSNRFFSEISTRKIVDAGISEYLSLRKTAEYLKLLKGFTGSVATIFISIVISFYLLVCREEIVNKLREMKQILFGKRFRKVTWYVKKTIRLFCSYFTGLAADAFTVGTLTSLGLWILGVEYPLVIGTVVGIGNLIPVFGCIAATVFAAVVTVSSGGFLSLVTMLSFVLTVYVVDGYFIQPLIVGKSTGVKPLVSLAAVTVLGKLFGVAGMFLAVPLCAVLKMLLKDFLTAKEKGALPLIERFIYRL